MQKKLHLMLGSLLAVVIINTASAQENCLKVDLQAVSISPVNIHLEPGKLTQLEVVMRNNGPCLLAKGEATAQITINAEHIEIPADIQFSDECGDWTFLTSTTEGNLKNLFFRNNGGALPVGGKFCAFRFSVKAKNNSAGVSTITLASSLSASAKSSDMNGNNQSAYTEITIKGKPSETKPPAVKTPKQAFKLEGKSDECTAILSWESESKSVQGFEIEISTDKVNFSKIGELNPAQGKEYKFETDQLNSRKYYRIKLNNTDGSSHYSTIAEIETKCKVKKGFLP